MKKIISFNGDEHYVITELEKDYIARNILTREIVTVSKNKCVLLSQ